MTGYGRAQREVGGKLITVEIKSVNHRFFEPNIRTPRGMGFLELPVKTRLARDIRRGKAEIYIAVEYPAGEEIDVSYNRQYLSGWLHTLGTISREHGVPGEISLADVAKNHDVFVVKKAEPAEQELTEIDSKFGDADHGLTMSKIARAVTEAVDQSEGGIQAMLDDAATAVMSLNGGSAVPLWNTWLDGMQEAAPEGEEIDVPGLQALFAKALEELNDMSGAQVGDKTMMDALIPASRAIAAYAGSDEDGLFAAAAKAAAEGAENSKNFVSKFGRAKSYGTQTIGTPDAGAMSMSYFFQGLAQA